MTIDSLFAKLSVTDVHDDLFRNIVSLRKEEDLFDDLSPDPADWNSAIELEMASKPPMFTSHLPVIHRPFEESAWNESIGYPFRNWMQSRYSDGSFGIWYGNDRLETTVYETAYHWRFGLLEDAGFIQPGIRIERRVFRVRCDAALLDLRGLVTRHPELVHPQNYSFTHQVGIRLHHEGHPGLVTQSARCSGDVFALFNPNVLSDPRRFCDLTYTTTGNGINVERKRGELLLSIH